MIDVYLKDTVSIVTPAEADKFGDPVGDDTVASVNARVNWKTKLVRNFAGEEVVAAGTVLLKASPDHAAQIRIDDVDHAILAIAEKKHFSVSHYEVAIA